MDKLDYIIYTDGAYSRKHNEGAFAYVMLDANGNEIKRHAWKIQNETNNRAELKAIIAALFHLPKDAKDVSVHSDSQYALNTLFNGWARNANTDLFEVFDKMMSERRYNVETVWVKGHSGDYYNELCDQLCNDILGYEANAETEYFRKKKELKKRHVGEIVKYKGIPYVVKEERREFSCDGCDLSIPCDKGLVGCSVTGHDEMFDSCKRNHVIFVREVNNQQLKPTIL